MYVYNKNQGDYTIINSNGIYSKNGNKTVHIGSNGIYVNNGRKLTRDPVKQINYNTNNIDMYNINIPTNRNDRNEIDYNITEIDDNNRPKIWPNSLCEMFICIIIILLFQYIIGDIWMENYIMAPLPYLH